MDWQAVGVIVAMLAVALSFVMTWRGQKQDKLIAEAGAARSEAAARLTSEYTERVVNALEAIADKDFTGTSPATAVRKRVAWTMAHHAGDTYMLTNVGAVKAFDVQLSGHETLIGPEHVNGGPDLDAGEALTFMAVRVMGTQDSTITVSWLMDPTHPERSEWRYPLPARPRR